MRALQASAFPLPTRPTALVAAALVALSLAGCVGGSGTDGGGGPAGAADSGGGDSAVVKPDDDSGSSGATDAATGGDTDAGGPADGGGDTGGATDAGSDVASGTDASSETSDDAGGTDAGGTDVTDTAETATGCTGASDCPAPKQPCQVASCGADGVCGAKAADDGAACDDASACTTDDKCTAGSCSGAKKVCDDGNPCTDDSCVDATGCATVDNTAQCNDNDPCTLADACKAGKCVPGAADKCDDGNPCTDDSCGVLDADKGSKGCKYANNQVPCEDGSKCTAGDVCAAGLCTAGTPTSCDDKNSCTSDSCNAKTGCVATPEADAAACDDGNACTDLDSCDKGQCKGSPLKCDDKNPCTKDACSGGSGCTATPDDTATCDDGNSCTTNDSCAAGACKGTGKVCADDGNPCTDETCANNECTSVANGAVCDDANPCTQKDVCKNKVCGGGELLTCDDSNPCTDDSCDKASGGLCKNAFNTKTCDDSDGCTTEDACVGGACLGKPLACDDGKPCTIDACDDKTQKCASVNYADGTACDDGTVCSQNDACKAGVCQGVTINCDDGNPCTDDSCDVAKGCANAANTAKCEDGNKCTLGDTCKDKACTAGTTFDKCDDANPCSDDFCDAGKGCGHDNNTAGCDDNNPCTTGDVCKSGGCVGGAAKVCDDGQACTDDSCDKLKGCVAANNTATCNDNDACTVSDVCAAGKCAGKPGPACDDKNPCTADSCDPKSGCVYKPGAAGGACDDDNGCTTGDKCDAAGKCAGVGKNCDDANPCTTDSCANNICSYANNKNPCTDNDMCTTNDTCDGAGACKGTGALNCSDTNPCTDTSCDKLSGCVVSANAAPCNDDNFCTEKDTCKDKACTVSAPKNCDDGNLCTNDSCDATAKACVNAANAAACDDGDKCTSGDKCSATKCMPGTPMVCDDGNPCTVDACDKVAVKCVFTLTTDAAVCKSFTIPSVWPIDFGDPLWTGGGGTATVKFATDASPAAPGKLTGAASLNVNNGTTYGDGNTIKAWGIGKFYVDATAYTGPHLTVAFQSYMDVAEPGIDRGWIEFSSDNFATKLATFQVPETKAWTYLAHDIKGLIGKKFQVRFYFDTIDPIANSGAGWFVDEVKIYGGPIVPISLTASYSDDFDNNNNGWQFTAANPQGTVWAVDATGAIGPSAVTNLNKNSLNYNNGTDFSGLANGAATSPVIDLSGAAGANKAILLFKEYVESETGGNWDKRWVEASGESFVSLPVATQLNSSAAWQKGWRWSWVDLTALKGKKIDLRFRFDSGDTAGNSGKGWFVDELQLSTAPPPSYAETVTCANPSAFTISNYNAVGWAVDANAGDMAYSADCSLNLSTLNGTVYNFVCPTGATKVGGTAKTAAFTVVASATFGAKSWLRFRSYFDGETSPTWDKATIVVQQVGTTVSTTFTLDKVANYQKWVEVAYDISAYNGKLVTVTFSFDSGDCGVNTGKGWFIDDIMVRADK